MQTVVAIKPANSCTRSEVKKESAVSQYFEIFLIKNLIALSILEIRLFRLLK